MYHFTRKQLREALEAAIYRHTVQESLGRGYDEALRIAVKETFHALSKTEMVAITQAADASAPPYENLSC